MPKDQSFPDGPLKADGYGDLSPHVCNGPRVHEYLQEMNDRVLSHYDLLTVGEAAGVTIDEAKKYARSDGKELGMVFQFEHVGPENGKGSIIDKWTTGKPQMPDVRAILNKWQLELEGKAWNSLYLDNHDQPRCVSMFGNDSPEWRVLSAKMLATCLHMQKGTPYIYQGEELGMTNTTFHSLADCQDLEEINAWHQYVDEQKKVTPETIQAQISSFHNTGMRQKIYERDGFTIIEDCYNAGPESTEAALEILAGFRSRTNGRCIAVLGDMLELGNRSAAEHYRIGRIAATKADVLYTYGVNAERMVSGAITGGMKQKLIEHFDTHEDLEHMLKMRARPGDVILFKGSRGMRMEKALALFFKEEEE